MIIAMDGPAASGKGTIAKGIAARYGLKLLDTGSLYRAVALALLDRGLDPRDAGAAAACARALNVEAIDQDRIRSNAVGAASSVVAANPAVRAELLAAQRRFAAAPEGAVMEGRDIGTVVCPDADVKFFVTAALDTRVQRRLTELQGRGESIEFSALRDQIVARDKRDAERPVSPMRQAPDAHLLDTTHLSIEGAVAAACDIIDAARKGSPG
jgi:cytidylate kinase